MALGFSGGQQLQVGSAPQHQVQGLGNDILGLFGAIGKTAATGVQILEESAKIEFLSQQNIASEEIIKQRAILDKASVINDTKTMLDVKSNIDSITARLVAKSEDFRNHSAAYDAYHTRAVEFSTSMRENMNHEVDMQYFRASKENRFSEIEILEEQKAKTGMLFNSQDYDDSNKQNEYSFLKEEDVQKVYSIFFKHNISSLNNVLTKIPSKVVSQYGLFTQDKSGNVSYSLDAERKMLLDRFGDTYTTDDVGQVISGKGNKQPDEQEKNLIAQALVSFRSKVLDSQGNAWSAEFEEYMARAEENLTSYKNGDMTDEVLSKDKNASLALDIPLSNLSSEQVKKRERFLIDQKLSKERNTLIYNTFESFMHKSVAEISSSLTVMKNEGISLAGGLSIDGGRVSREATKWANNGDAYTRQLFNSGDTQKLISVLPSWMKMHQAITGNSLPVMDDIRDIVNGSSTKAYSADERLKANTILASLSKSGDVTLPVANQNVIEQQALDIEKIRQESIDENGKFSKDLFNKNVNKHIAGGKTLQIETMKLNSVQLKNEDIADIMASTFKYPDSKYLSEEERMYISRVAAFQGIVFKTKDDFKDFMKNNFTMKQKGTFTGKVTFVPNVVNDNAHSEIEKYMYAKAKIPPDSEDYSISYIIKDSVGMSVRVNMTDGAGRVVYRQDFDIGTLNALSSKTVYREPSNKTKPTPVKKQYTKVKAENTVPRKGVEPKAPPQLSIQK